MAVFEVVVQTESASQFFTNVYHVNDVDLDTAITTAGQIAAIQAQGLTDYCTITAYRVSTPALRDGVFATIPVSIPGSRASSGERMPLFNRFLVSFQAGHTYLNRKFLAGMVEGDQAGGQVLGTVRTSIFGLYVQPLLALGVLCNPNGVIYTAGSVGDQVAMRQLRRKKKRSSPVI